MQLISHKFQDFRHSSTHHVLVLMHALRQHWDSYGCELLVGNRKGYPSALENVWRGANSVLLVKSYQTQTPPRVLVSRCASFTRLFKF